jgi:hypothetical protein
MQGISEYNSILKGNTVVSRSSALYWRRGGLYYPGIRIFEGETPWYRFIHLVISLMTGPKPLPKTALHIVRSRASSYKQEYPLLSLRSSSSVVRLLPRFPVTSILPFIFPSITRCRRQFLRKMWPIQSAFRLLISCRIYLCSLTLSNTSSFLTWSVQLIFSVLLQHHIDNIPKKSSFRAKAQPLGV